MRQLSRIMCHDFLAVVSSREISWIRRLLHGIPEFLVSRSVNGFHINEAHSDVPLIDIVLLS